MTHSPTISGLYSAPLPPVPEFIVPPPSPEDALAPPEFRTVCMVPGLSALTRKRLLTYANQCIASPARRAKNTPSLLMHGPAGTGKTMLGAVIARHTGRQFIYAQISQWDSAGPLNSHLTAMRAAFEEAAGAEPSVFFLDEVDRFSHRQNAGHYHIQVVNAMLEMVTNLRSKADVAIIAATNLPKTVDSALVRPGRLGDNTIEVSYPDEAGVHSLIAHLTRNSLTEADIGSFAVQFGDTTSPADIVAWVEQAKAAAYQANQRLNRVHLQNALEQITGIGTINPGLVFRIAVHELGHAAVACSLHSPEAVQSVSVKPTLSGSLGVTRFAALGTNCARGIRINSQESWIETIAVLMGGYAAERQFLAAKGGASLGAGDDVKRCREIATAMVASGLCASTNPATRPFVGQHPGQIDEILEVAYSRAEAVLQTITTQAMFSAANQLMSLGFATGAQLKDIMTKLLRSSGAGQEARRQPSGP